MERVIGSAIRAAPTLLSSHSVSSSGSAGGGSDSTALGASESGGMKDVIDHMKNEEKRRVVPCARGLKHRVVVML